MRASDVRSAQRCKLLHCAVPAPAGIANDEMHYCFDTLVIIIVMSTTLVTPMSVELIYTEH